MNATARLPPEKARKRVFFESSNERRIQQSLVLSQASNSNTDLECIDTTRNCRESSITQDDDIKYIDPCALQRPFQPLWKEKQEISNEGRLQDGVAKVWTEKRRRDRRDRRSFERGQSNNNESCQSSTRSMTTS